MQAERFSGSSQENIILRLFESSESGFGQLNGMGVRLCGESIKLPFVERWDRLRECLGS